MATTEIHAITATPNRALGYVLADKVTKYVNDKEINKGVTYNLFESNGVKYVQYFTLSSYQSCNMLNPYSTYKDLQNKWQNVRYKNNGNKSKKGQEPLMWHLHQSFEGHEVSPTIANEIGLKLAVEVFKGFSVTVSTHCNTENIHNHFIVSAWNNEGKKWNDCHATKRQIREVSDRLCKEYGLSVLDNTKNMNLIKYKDKNGVVRYFEPTNRKNDLIRKRKEGRVATDDVRSYRNTTQYQESNEKKLSNRETIKKDIDNLLPSCRSYEELLLRLRDLGYEIRDKKKNGGWLAYISFLAPLQDKATRDDKIGDNEFYKRENLSRYIENSLKKLEEKLRNDTSELSVPYFDNYAYGKTNIDMINDNYKTVRLENGSYLTERRPQTERKIIVDIRIKDNEIKGLIDTTNLHKLIKEQNKVRKEKKPIIEKTYEHKLVAQIQNSFRCLQYVEKHSVYSYKQIIDLYSANKTKYDATIDNFTKIENALNHLKKVSEIPQKIEKLQSKIDTNKNDVSYILEDYTKDKKQLETYKNLLIKYKIDSQKGEGELKRKLNEFESKQNNNRRYLAKVIDQMSELENCIRTLDRIDRENGRENNSVMKKFELLVKKEDEVDYNEKTQIKYKENKYER